MTGSMVRFPRDPTTLQPIGARSFFPKFLTRKSPSSTSPSSIKCPAKPTNTTTTTSRSSSVSSITSSDTEKDLGITFRTCSTNITKSPPSYEDVTQSASSPAKAKRLQRERENAMAKKQLEEMDRAMKYVAYGGLVR